MRDRLVFVATDDGERLAVGLYLPDGDGPFAVLLEALPYRQHDVTASYRSTYERYVADGFAVARLDLRGTGSSSGILHDEYSDVERDDLRTVIEWLAGQPWSSGRVGMFGTSYSGFNALHMAADGVPALGAVVAIYATDDRYTDDVHYAGGVLRAIDLIDYPLYMVAMNALPPVPGVFGPGWRDEWLRRVNDTPPWLLEWITHPLDGPTWRRGSIRLGPGGEGYERMTCPTMLVAGWADGYRNNTFRVIEQYGRHGLPWRLLAGPWVHKSPSTGLPGPHVDDDALIVEFFDEHLRGGAPRTSAPGRVYVRAPGATPQPDLAHQPGTWRDLSGWPPPGLRWRRLQAAPREPGLFDRLVVRGDVGWSAWNSCGGAMPWGQPLDQQADNGRSLCYDWPIVGPDGVGELIGQPVAHLSVQVDRPYGHISVKLCDVAPDGTSALITRGMLDLSHRGVWPVDPDGAVGADVQPVVPGEWMDVAIELESTTWTLVSGHRLRLAVAGSDWPNCWPPPGPLTLTVNPALVLLEVPVVTGLALSAPLPPGDGHSGDDRDGVTWRIEHDVMADETRAITRYGGPYDGARGAKVVDDYRGEAGVSTIDPGDAWVRGTSSYEITWPGEGVGVFAGVVTCRTEATLEVRSDAHGFDVRLELEVSENGEHVARRVWSTSVPRLPHGRAWQAAE